MFTQGLSREVGERGITVNNVQPGPIDTDLNPATSDWAIPQIANTALKRYGTVDEVAALTPDDVALKLVDHGIGAFEFSRGGAIRIQHDAG